MAEPTPTSTAPDEVPLPVRAVLFVAGCGSVIPLLAWVYGLGKFSDWGLFVGAPLVALTIGTAIWLDRSGRYPGTRAAITAGAIGGLVGTIGYDVFRIPFQYGLGLQLLAPIDSYGVLLLDAATSSGTTGTAAWLYHFTNGIGFGVAYAVIGRGRHWGWGVAWALVLETATIISPFATAYGLISDDGVKVLPITLAYLAHIPYGYAVGRFVQHADAAHREARDLSRRPVLVLVGALVVAVVAWQRPLLPNEGLDLADEVGDQPAVVVRDGRFEPQWVRIAAVDCFTIRNLDDEPHVIDRFGPVGPRDGADLLACSADEGVHRVRVDDEPWSGGFLIVDGALRPCADTRAIEVTETTCALASEFE